MSNSSSFPAKISAIYCRESTEKQNIQSLIDMCKKAAKKINLQNIKVYYDVASGYNKDREQYSKLKEDIQNNLVDTLVLYESSRLTRDELEHHIFYGLLRVHNVKVYTVTHGWLDLQDADDTFLTNLLNLLDAREGRKTAKRSKDRMTELAEQGRWTGGPAPLGYKLVNKELVIVPEDAEKVKTIFKLFLDGKTRQSIANFFGYEVKKVRRLLENPVYIGKLKFHSVEIINKKKILHKDYKVLNGIHEPIIDESTFSLVQGKLKNIKVERNTDVYIFKDLIKCTCGRKMYRVVNKYNYLKKSTNEISRKTENLYYCRTSDKYKSLGCGAIGIHEEELFEEVMASLKKIIFSLEVENIDTKFDDYQSQLVLYKKELASLSRKEELLARQLLNSLISEEVFEKLMKELKEKKAFLEEKIKNLTTLITNKKNTNKNSEILKKYFFKLEKEKAPEKINNFLKLIIDEIEMVNDYRFYIHLKF